MGRHGLTISSLAYYPNNLHPDDAHREEVNGHLRKVIDAAQRLDVGIVGTFVGNDKDRPVPENLERFRQIWPPLVDHAGERDVKIAIENCPMIFSYDEWPGGNNLAYAPAIWDEMFSAIPAENFGLNIDPSHLVWLMIDYEQAVYDYRDRIFHAHAKDLEVRRDGLYRHGTFSSGIGWQVPRLPGLGEVRWDRFLAALYAVGYDHVLSIEHEDRRFEGDEDLVKRGFLLARERASSLRRLRVEHELDPVARARGREGALPLGERHDLGDQRVELDVPLGDELERFRPRRRRAGEAGGDRELPEADEIEGERDRLSRQPDLDIAAAAPARGEALRDSSLAARALDDDVRLDRVILGRARLEAELARGGEAELVARRSAHVHLAARPARDLRRQ